MMKYKIDLQNVVTDVYVPTVFLLHRWTSEVLKNHLKSCEICIRVVDEQASATLNLQYRQKNKPTNVLSFPYEMPQQIKSDRPLLGDLVICASIVEQEAKEQEKSIDAHWAHMVVHGILHLLGYDHTESNDAKRMEKMEIEIMNQLGHANPYGDE